MNRKDLIVSIVVASIALAGSPASAELQTYAFSDTIDFTSSLNPYWDSSTDSASYGKYMYFGTGSSGAVNNPFSYTHDIRSEVDFDAGDLVTEATLTVTFWDDEGDSGGTVNQEVVRTGVWNGTDWLWQDIPDADTGAYSGPTVNVDWINDDGQLLARIELTNNKGDIYLTSSTLSGIAAVVPLGPAVMLGVLGFAVAGWRLRKFV